LEVDKSALADMHGRDELLSLETTEGYVREMGSGLSRSEMYAHLTRSFGISVTWRRSA